jgi:hypothetical protein
LHGAVVAYTESWEVSSIAVGTEVLVSSRANTLQIRVGGNAIELGVTRWAVTGLLVVAAVASDAIVVLSGASSSFIFISTVWVRRTRNTFGRDRSVGFCRQPQTMLARNTKSSASGLFTGNGNKIGGDRVVKD